MTGHIFIEGEIGTEVTAKTVRADVSQYPQAKDFIVHVNSGGGDVYEGELIGSIIQNLGKPTTAHIGALCASIATYDALCCDHVVMNPHGDFMIHLPTGTLSGTAEDLRRGAAQLDRIKNELIDRYMTRVAKKGVTRDQLSAMIDKETSMSPSEALAMGFVDAVQEKLKAVAKIDINKFQMETTLTKEQAEGFFTNLGNKIDNLLKKFKNAVQIALADGSMATSDAPTPDALVGSAMTGADGAPLADGDYETADGFTITIAGGKVTAYEPLMADNKDQVAQLQKQVAELTAQLAAKSTEATQAVQAAAKKESEFRNEFKNLKTEFDALKAKTLGDEGTPPPDPEFKADKGGNPKAADPMNDLADAYKTSRYTNFN